MTSSCDLFTEDLVAYSDGELRAARKELLEAHLQVCPHCRRQLAAFAEVDRLLQEATPLRDDPDARAMLRARLERQRQRALPPWRHWRLRWLAALIAVVALALVGANQVLEPRVLVWDGGLPSVALTLRECWPACTTATQAAQLPEIDAGPGEALDIVIARPIPDAPDTVTIRMEPLNRDVPAISTTVEGDVVIHPTAPQQPGDYRLIVNAQWDGEGSIETGWLLDVTEIAAAPVR